MKITIDKALLAAGLACLTALSSAADNNTDENQPPQLLQVIGAQRPKAAAINIDFPDPSIVQDTNGLWYAFATSGNGKMVQMAWAQRPQGPWTVLDQDPLPDAGSWTSGRKSTWAPDVRRVGDGSYVMYYSGELRQDDRRHCIGAARSRRIDGPYRPQEEPLACHLGRGGSIDPSGFVDAATGRRYVVYKVDGNALGHGGECNNGVAPQQPTPILLQEVSALDGVTRVGDAVEILDRQDRDGPLVEAPNLVRTRDGTYVLLFSAHCYDSPRYNVAYAVAAAVTGPFRRPSGSLLQTGDFNLTSPGGATASIEAGVLVFHAACPRGRCMYASAFAVRRGDVIVA